MKDNFGSMLIVFGVVCCVIGVGVTSVAYQVAWRAHNLRAIESGDAQYHPTTGKFMFNGELKAEKNE